MENIRQMPACSARLLADARRTQTAGGKESSLRVRGRGAREETSARTRRIETHVHRLNAKCDEEVWVELPDEFKKIGRYAKLKRWLYGMRKAASGWEDDCAKKTGGGRVSTRQRSINDIPPSQDAGASRRAWRRLHV